MEAFVKNLNPEAKKDKVQEWLTPFLERFDIHAFDLQKPWKKPWGRLVVPDVIKAQRLIREAQGRSEIPRHPGTGQQVLFMTGRNKPDDLLVKVLREEEKAKALNQSQVSLNARNARANRSEPHPATLRVASIECGRWKTSNDRTYFVRYFVLHGENGAITKQGRTMSLKMDWSVPKSRGEIVFEYANIESIVLRRTGNQMCLVLTLTLAPRIYEHTGLSEDAFDLYESLLSLFPDVQLPVFRDGKLP